MNSAPNKTRILFVCTGNICRSPTAEGVFRYLAREAGLDGHVHADSAGTHGYHVGEPPDPRAMEHAAARGYDLSGITARRVRHQDFLDFDLILAMDGGHLRQLERLSPPDSASRLSLFLEFAENPGARDVPDPYYGGRDGFERALDLIEAGSRGLIERLKRGVL